MIKVILIGAGNIMATRHLPALRRHPELFDITGILDIHLDRARTLANMYRIPNYAAYDGPHSFSSREWVRASDAAIIATPPYQHASMIRVCVNAGLHVLTEKPFVTDLKEGKELEVQARKAGSLIAVNHNFQFSHAFSRLSRLIENGQLGDLRSMYCAQITNDARRLPVWADDLPLGLFYDETPHVFYLMKRFGGSLSIQNAYAVPSSITQHTPQSMTVHLQAGKIPSSLYINFESPVCEWHFTIFGSRKMAIVDMFRDILIVLPNDGQHLMREVFTTSILSTSQHWAGVVANGVQYMRHNLFYGIDVVHHKFHDAVQGDRSALQGISIQDGLAVNSAQWDVIRHART